MGGWLFKDRFQRLRRLFSVMVRICRSARMPNPAIAVNMTP